MKIEIIENLESRLDDLAQTDKIYDAVEELQASIRRIADRIVRMERAQAAWAAAGGPLQ